MPKKDKENKKRLDPGASTSRGYKVSPPSSSSSSGSSLHTRSTTSSEAKQYPSRTQKKETKKYKEIAEKRGSSQIVHTRHHVDPKSSISGKKEQGRRSSVFLGPEPKNRSDDPGNKGYDIQYVRKNGKLEPSEASRIAMHGTKEERKAASKARKPKQLVKEAERLWELDKNTNKYKKKPVSMFAACFGVGKKRERSPSPSSDRSGQSPSKKDRNEKKGRRM